MIDEPRSSLMMPPAMLKYNLFEAKLGKFDVCLNLKLFL